MGSKLITFKDNEKLFSILATYINDSSPEVRYNSRNAILALEYGTNPFGSREDIEKLIKKYIIKDFD
jgi:hypothetical protein